MNATVIKELRPNFRVDQVVEGRSHFYDVTADGKVERYPGVTGFLGVINKPALVNWAAKQAVLSVEGALTKRLNGSVAAKIVMTQPWIKEVMAEASRRPKQVKDQAADLGTQAHAVIDLIVRGQEPGEIVPDIQAPVAAFREWWKSSGIQIVLGDTKVASRRYGFGGSLDALGWRDGHYVMLDWKTSNGLYDEYALQVAAYSQAFFETYGHYCDEAIVVRFGKKPPIGFEWKKVADMQRSFRTFLAAKELKEAFDQPHFEQW
jgi:hypothetical protein